MAKLISNECVNCRRVLGYVVEGTLQLPTLCVICAADHEVMEEWGHEISSGERKPHEVLLDYKFVLGRIQLG